MAIIQKPEMKSSGNETGMEHVRNLLTYTTHFSIYHSTRNEKIYTDLIDLSALLKQQEQQFYDALGVGNIAGLNSLLKTINQVNNLSALDAGGAVMQEVSNRYVFKDASKAEQQKIQKQEQDIFNLLNQALNNIDADTFISRYMNNWTTEREYIFNGCMDALTEIINGLEIGNGLITYRFTAFGKGKSNFTGYYSSKQELGQAKITILNLNNLFAKRGSQHKITIKDNHFQIEGNSQALTESLQVEFRDRIRPALENYLNIEYEEKHLLENMSLEQIRTAVNNIIKEKGINLSSEDLIASRNIAIGRGAGNISGYLGELQSRLYFKALFSNVKDARIIDAGASYIKSMSGAKQMDPADTMIEVANHIFNIQVKNYAKGGAEWGGGGKSRTIQVLGQEKDIREYSQAQNFVSERLQINDNALVQFFGAATWHNLNPDYSNNPKYVEYSELYQEFFDIFNSLKDSFDTFLPNIIRLSAIINGADLQYENFYFQKGVMIPASGIIDGIIDALYNAPSNKIFTSSYEMYPGSSYYSYQHPYEKDYTPYAKETLISWHVSVNFNSILRNIGL